MPSGSIPPDWYQVQEDIAAQDLDYDLHLTTCEAGIKEGIAASLEPMPKPAQQQPDNSVYNFNAILDGLLD